MTLIRPYLFFFFFLKKGHSLWLSWDHKESDTTEQLTELNCGSADKESACSTGDLGSIPGLGRFPGEGKDYTLQYSALENSMD